MINIENRIDAWLTQPEVNAAGRLGIYRIIYCLVYLIFMSVSLETLGEISKTPVNSWNPTPILLWMASPPPEMVIMFIVAVQTIAIILLLLGWKVRWMTGIILVAGILTTAFKISVGGKVDHSGTFHVVYIPLIMWFAPWGDTFSLDSVLKQRQGKPIVDPTTDDFRYSWAFKALLWLLAIMFMLSGLLKMIPPGQWVTDLDVLRKLILINNLDAQEHLRFFVATLPIVPFILQLMGMLFETLYPIAVVNKSWRRLMVSSAVFFHIGTRITLGIWFGSMLFFYMIFFDIYAVYRKFFPHRLLHAPARLLNQLPSWSLIALAWLIAIAIFYIRNQPMLWNSIVRPIRQITFDEIWVVAGVLGAYGVITALIQLFHLWRDGRLFAMDS